MRKLAIKQTIALTKIMVVAMVVKVVVERKSSTVLATLVENRDTGQSTVGKMAETQTGDQNGIKARKKKV